MSVELASKRSGPENSSPMSDSSTANQMTEVITPRRAGATSGQDSRSPRLRLAGTCAGPLTPTVERLLELRRQLIETRAVILEEAGFIRRRLERAGRRDAIACITGEDAFAGAATGIDHEISRVELELARLDEKAVSIETTAIDVGRLQRDS